MNEHPMQPPPELFSEWYAEACLEIKPNKESGMIAGRVARAALARYGRPARPCSAHRSSLLRISRMIGEADG